VSLVSDLVVSLFAYSILNSGVFLLLKVSSMMSTTGSVDCFA